MKIYSELKLVSDSYQQYKNCLFETHLHIQHFWQALSSKEEGVTPMIQVRNDKVISNEVTCLFEE